MEVKADAENSIVVALNLQNSLLYDSQPTSNVISCIGYHKSNIIGNYSRHE